MTLENNFNNQENREAKIVNIRDIERATAKILPFKQKEELKLEKLGKLGKLVNMMTGAAFNHFVIKKPEALEDNYFKGTFA